ncbi:hypothetical protein BRC81_04880 [Halobacteriales archaeon QS_1_68_20]|nr:MAG: hypothetical protein BRC81_04880 [Halobacteriales archaeon QS_1_68_20]
MDEVELTIPATIVESLPEGSEDAVADMERAVEGFEASINEAVRDAEDGEAAAAIVDAIEQMEARAERYDEFVPELRAWGQSPIYAIAWRNLHLALIRQLYDHDAVGDRIDRERNFRLVDDGIRKR